MRQAGIEPAYLQSRTQMSQKYKGGLNTKSRHLTNQTLYTTSLQRLTDQATAAEVVTSVYTVGIAKISIDGGVRVQVKVISPA